MNKTTAFLLIIIAAMGFMFVGPKSSKAQDKSFAGVVTFVTNSDRLGFFDQKDGKIYVYDNNIHQCLFVGQMQDLGQPVTVISAQNLSNVNPSAL